LEVGQIPTSLNKYSIPPFFNWPLPIKPFTPSILCLLGNCLLTLNPIKMERSKIISIYNDLIRFGLIFLFGFTAIDKIINWYVTVQQMSQQFLPEFIKPFLPILIPGLELSLVIFLIFEQTKKMALLASFTLMACFTTYVAFVIIKDADNTPCSCGGILSTLNWQDHLWLNAIITLLTIISLITYQGPKINLLSKY